MGRLKLVGVVCLCFIFKAKLISSNELNRFALNWTNTFFTSNKSDALILKSNDKYIRIACDEKWSPSVPDSLNSSFIFSPINSNKSCVVPAYEWCPGQVYAVALGNGKIVIKEQNPYERDGFISIVNPKTCTNQTFRYNQTRQKGLKFIPYLDTFDLYRGDDAIYRYNDKGVLYDTINDTSLNAFPNFYKFFTLNAANSTARYFSYVRLDGGNSEIYALNSTYRRTEAFHFDHRIDAFSTEHNRFGLCYSLASRLQCKILDSGLKLLVNATAIEIDEPIKKMAVHNTVDGGAIVVYAIGSGSTAHVYYSLIRPDGSTGDKNILIDEIEGDKTEVYIGEISAATKAYCIYLAPKYMYLGDAIDTGVVKAYCNNA